MRTIARLQNKIKIFKCPKTSTDFMNQDKNWKYMVNNFCYIDDHEGPFILLIDQKSDIEIGVNNTN